MADDETQDESADDAAAIDAMNATPEDGDGDEEVEGEGEGIAEAESFAAPPLKGEPEDVAPGLTERELEANHRKIETARKNFYNRISEIMGEDAQQLVECPACSYFVPGLIFPVEFDDSVKVALWSYMGLPDPNYYEDAPDRRQCPTCKGKTMVKTGSLDSVWALGKCRTCGGKGFVDDLLPVQIDNDTNGALPDDPFEVAPPMPEDEAWIEAARARGYTIVPPFEQPHA